MKKIVIDSDIPYLSGVLDSFAKVDYIKGVDICRADVAHADALVVRTRTKCDSKLLEGSSVRLIVTATIGYDHIDTEYCQNQGIEIVTAAGCNARGVLQWIAGVLAHVGKRQGWQPSERTLGVVGVGHVGSLVVEYARMWGFKVLACDPPRQMAEKNSFRTNRNGDCDGENSDCRAEKQEIFVTLDTILQEADIITFHTPLTRDGHHATYHMADDAFFAKVRPGTLIINSSRGEVVDSHALKHAIATRGCLCAIDTWEHEPEIDTSLLESAIVATTHIAGYTAQGKANGSAIAVNCIASRFGFPIASGDAANGKSTRKDSARALGEPTLGHRESAGNWFPSEHVAPSWPKPISWSGMCASIGGYFDCEVETSRLKSDLHSFESTRNNYLYRTEYF